MRKEFGFTTLVRVTTGVLTLLMVLNPLVAESAIAPSNDFRPGLSFSRVRPLTAKQQGALVKGLQRLTGFREIKPDDEGYLVLGDRARILGGSPTARALFAAVVDGDDSYIIENHDHSPALAFARIRDRLDYVNCKSGEGQVRRLRSVEIDFHDYNELRGSAEAIRAFDPTLNLLHELAHAALGLRDATTEEDSLGDCERYINRIRRELGIPERQSYKPTKSQAVTPFGTGQRVLAELSFVGIKPGKGIKTFRLMFDVENVGNAVPRAPRRPLRAELKSH